MHGVVWWCACDSDTPRDSRDMLVAEEIESRTPHAAVYRKQYTFYLVVRSAWRVGYR
jgi:hypothetical protein